MRYPGQHYDEPGFGSADQAMPFRYKLSLKVLELMRIACLRMRAKVVHGLKCSHLERDMLVRPVFFVVPAL